MHTMWKGSLSFGLVNVPVRMFAATESKDIKLRYLHKECQTPIRYTRTCPACERAVEWNEIVRGYEYEPNRFVILEEEDFETVQKARSHTIDIVDFVELADIDPVYYDKTYFLAPDSSGIKAYRLLQKAMENTGKIAIAKTVLRNTETLACVRVRDDVIIVETLFWPAEVRSTEELPNLRDEINVSDSELDMAVTLIEQLATPFNPSKYTDERNTQLTTLIEQKIANEEVSAPAADTENQRNIVDLMDALQESIKLTKPDKGDTPVDRKSARKATTRKAKSTATSAKRKTSKKTS